jgi:dTDP-4-dehydrorhamnose 3,5-epimerase
MIFIETGLKGAYELEPERHTDDRGFFARTFCQREFAAHGLRPEIAQVSIASNRLKGTLRGMHFQYPPAAETKIVRCTRGAVLDVIVDLRPESPTFLRSFAAELTDANRRALYVPERFAHGYQSLSDDSEVLYEISQFHTPELASGLRYDDPALGLSWPLPVTVVSTRDQQWPPLGDVELALRAQMSADTAGIGKP